MSKEKKSISMMGRIAKVFPLAFILFIMFVIDAFTDSYIRKNEDICESVGGPIYPIAFLLAFMFIASYVGEKLGLLVITVGFLTYIVWKSFVITC